MRQTGITSASWFTEEHAQFQASVRGFFEREMTPQQDKWRAQGYADRSFWMRAGEMGLLGAAAPEELGGTGAGKSYEAIVLYETALKGETSWGFMIQTVVLHYILAYGTSEQKTKWVPGLVDGSIIGAIAMTEPDCGSDLLAMTSTAKAVEGGYVLNGAKTYITHGTIADLIIVAARTKPGRSGDALSLFLLDAHECKGLTRGSAMAKIGTPGSDTSDLFFDNIRMSSDWLLGLERDRGFPQLMNQLPWERLVLGVKALGAIDCAIASTIDFTQNRTVFGKRLYDMQNTRFKLAEAKAKSEMLRSFLNDAIASAEEDTLDTATASMAKFMGSDLQNQIISECVQLFGGAGFMSESLIARLYVDARVQTIYGGSNEIMKELIAKSLDREIS
ncbi:MAG: acyl-CoA dehydrogenase family protein [Pseudomonadota bacterium]